GEIAGNELRRELEFSRPLVGDLWQVRQAGIARCAEYLGDISQLVLRGSAGANRPKGEDEWPAGEHPPLMRQIPREVACAIDLQRRVSDEQRGVVARKHGIELRFRGHETYCMFPLLREQHLDERSRRSRRAVESNRPNRLQRYFAYEQNRANGVIAGDGDIRQNEQIFNACVSRNRDDSNICRSIGQHLSAARWDGVINLEIPPQFFALGAMLEIPHQRSGIEITDGGDAQSRHSSHGSSCGYLLICLR